MSQMMSAFNQSMSLESLVEMNRQNMEAASQASQCMTQGCSRLAARQMEQFKNSMEAYAENARKLSSAKSVDELMKMQSSMIQSAMESTMNNVREVAQMTQEMTAEASQVLEAQLQKSMAAAQASASKEKSASASASKTKAA